MKAKIESEKLNSTVLDGTKQEKKLNESLNLSKAKQNYLMTHTRDGRREANESVALAARGPATTRVSDLMADKDARGAPAAQLMMKELIRNKILAKKRVVEERLGVASQPLPANDKTNLSLLGPQKTKSDELSLAKERPDPPREQPKPVEKTVSVPQEIPKRPTPEPAKVEQVTTKNELKKFRTSLHDLKNEQTENSEDDSAPQSKKPPRNEPSELEIPEIKPRARQSPSTPSNRAGAPGSSSNVGRSPTSRPALSQRNLESGSLKSSRGRLKRLSTFDYEKMIAKVGGLDLSNPRLFALRPVTEGRVIQCTIFRDKSGLINKFYPIFHLHFSVS